MGQPLHQAHEQWELPEIDPDLRKRLKAEIQRWGRVLVPIVVDEHDNMIDGRLRWEIAQELGIKDVPRIVIPGLSENEKHDLRLILNICRRHLSREQIRQWIAWELIRNPHHSDRMVAGTIGVSPSTVGKVRAGVQDGHVGGRLGKDGNYYTVIHTQSERQRKEAQKTLQGLAKLPNAYHLSMRKLRTLRWEQRGCDTAETGVYASYVGNNDLLMERATRLYLKDGDRVADVTWGKGVFWNRIDISRFDFHRSDLLTCPEAPHNFTDLPYESASFDAVVFDPPYIHHPGELTSYRNSETTPGYYHDEIIDLYRQGMKEARRILKPGGYLFVKCMDEIESGLQRRGHIEVWEIAKKLGLSDQDLFLLTQKSPPQIQHPQRHARKNCSFLWVFSKP